MNNIFEHTLNIYKYWHNENISFDTVKSTKFHNFRLVENGKIVARCQNKIIEVNAGEVLYIPPERYAQIEVFAEPYCHGMVMRTRYFPGEDELSYPAQSMKITDECAEVFKNIPFTTNTNINASYICKVYKCLDLLQSNMVGYNDKRIPKLEKALEFMRQNNKYTIPELAKYCGMSERRFYSSFKDFTGLTPIKMKQKIQAIKAEVLLKTTDLTMEEILEQVGLKSDSYLRKILKIRYSKSPKYIRKDW